MDREHLESLVAEGVEILETRGPASFDAWCRSLSDRGAAVRVRLQTLAQAGLIDASGLSPQIPGFEILECLGAGGMGVVYRARQEEPFVREVALKCPRRDRFHPSQLARFVAEYQTLALLDHPSVARVYDAGRTEQGDLWFSMELIRGRPLTEWCDTNQASIDQRIALFLQVCGGVAHAHRHGFLHRDLKPANLLVAESSEGPVVKVIDFGLARPLETPPREPGLSDGGSPPLGTLEYASPEQVAGRSARIDVRSDVYSLGVILFELLGGGLPHHLPRDQEISREELERRLLSSPPMALVSQAPEILDEAARHRGLLTGRDLRRRLAGDLQSIVGKTVSAEQDLRYQSVGDLAADIRRHQQGLPVLATPPSLRYRMGRWVGRHRILVGVLGAVLATAAVGLVTTLHQARGWRRTVDKLDLLVAADSVEALIREEREAPPPATPAGVAALGSWRDRMGQALSDLRGLDPAIAELDREMVDGTEVLNRRLGALKKRLRGTRGLVVKPTDPSLRDESRLWRTIDLVERRWNRAQRLASASVAAATSDPLWEGVRQRLAQGGDPILAKLQVAPIPGLVPLGPDPASGREEFAVELPGCEQPRRRDDGGLQLPARFAPILVLIPGGSVRLGAQSADPTAPHFDPLAEAHEGPVREANLDPFFMGKFETTSDQWLALTGRSSDESHFYEGIDDDPNCPVNNVAWQTASWVVRGYGLRLPTEDQWEYAARAGTDTPWFTGTESMTTRGYANVYDAGVTAFRTGGGSAGSGGGPVRYSGAPAPFDDTWLAAAPVYSGRPNPFGLHHVIGNVREICDGPYRRREDPSLRPYRGSSWHGDVRDGRSTARMSVEADERSPYGGIRLAMDLPDTWSSPR